MMIQDPGKVKALPITQVIDTLNFLHPGGEVFELCVIGPKNPNSNLWEGRAGGKKPIVAGWFRAHGKVAALVAQVQATGIYVTLNPCQEALLARANERLKAQVDRTADHNITGIRNLLIDIDPIRPTGISSTDQEHEAALEMAQIIKADLAKEGWPEPLVGDSGNGAHLIYPLDLPRNDDTAALLKKVLAGLARRYADQLAHLHHELDQVVFNPARLTKLYGTWTRKGDDTPDRPHRLARIISLPAARMPVSVELLKAISQGTGNQKPPRDKGNGGAAGSFDLAAYLNHYSVEVLRVKLHGGADLHLLAACLFDASHADGEAAIGQAQDGTLFYQCFHDSCKTRTWADARTLISGADKLNQFKAGGAPRLSLAPEPPERDYADLEREFIQTEENAEAPARGPGRVPPLSLERRALLEDLSTGLRAGGWAEDRIAKTVEVLSQPAQSEKAKGISNLAAEVREWVLSTRGDFHSTDVDRELQLSTSSTSREEKKVILGTMSKALERLVKEGILDRVGTRRGHFRRIEKESEVIDFINADCSMVFDLRWPAPFRLEHLVNLYPKNVVIVAGATNAGKTALLLNVVQENMGRHRIIYFSSEMGPEELKLRLQKFQMPIKEWRFEARERGGNFADVIIPDVVNIIDYLELTDNFYQVGGEIKKIFDRLTTGIAIIAIQKDENKDLARGGAFSAEKARLYLSMNPGELKITKAKNWAQPGHNPNGKIFKFKLIDGCKFIEG